MRAPVGGSCCHALSDKGAMLLRVIGVGWIVRRRPSGLIPKEFYRARCSFVDRSATKNKSRAGQSRFSLMVIRGTEQKRTLRKRHPLPGAM
jgi:hypothetical protein